MKWRHKSEQTFSTAKHKNKFSTQEKYCWLTDTAFLIKKKRQEKAAATNYWHNGRKLSLIMWKLYSSLLNKLTQIWGSTESGTNIK